MFTGIVRERGKLLGRPEAAGDGVRMVFGLSAELADRLELGASLAVNGVCLTIVEFLEPPSGDGDGAAAPERAVAVELSPETLDRTTLGALDAGDAVNLEPALMAGDAMGGHWVQGHVDTVVRLLERRIVGEWHEFAFEIPEAYRGQMVEKGSVTLDGTSLTISRLTDASFEVALVPHTLEVTTLDRLKPGDAVNFEADILAKYVERALRVAGRLDGEGAP
ncbi:MAG: riboflavin synthase [Acidobacteriota bacterium]